MQCSVLCKVSEVIAAVTWSGAGRVDWKPSMCPHFELVTRSEGGHEKNGREEVAVVQPWNDKRLANGISDVRRDERQNVADVIKEEPALWGNVSQEG